MDKQTLSAFLDELEKISYSLSRSWGMAPAPRGFATKMRSAGMQNQPSVPKIKSMTGPRNVKPQQVKPPKVKPPKASSKTNQGELLNNLSNVST